MTLFRPLGNLFKLPPFSKEIKAILGVTPKDVALYKLALRHSSAYPFRKKKGERNNERLEFLGDSVLDLIVAEALYYRFPEEDEGYLTKLRSKLVSRQNLNAVADELGIPNLLVANLRGNTSESIYGDALEALVGACYLDHGLKKTQDFVVTHIVKPFLSNPSKIHRTHNYKSELIEYFQGRKIKFRFETLEQFGAQHSTTFVMGLFVDNQLIAKGEGPSKKKGEEAAARSYFNSLQLDKDE